MNKQTILYIHHGKGLGGAPISLLTLIKALDLTCYRPIVLFLYDSEALKLFRDDVNNPLSILYSYFSNINNFSGFKVVSDEKIIW